MANNSRLLPSPGIQIVWWQTAHLLWEYITKIIIFPNCGGFWWLISNLTMHFQYKYVMCLGNTELRIFVFEIWGVLRLEHASSVTRLGQQQNVALCEAGMMLVNLVKTLYSCKQIPMLKNYQRDKSVKWGKLNERLFVFPSCSVLYYLCSLTP